MAMKTIREACSDILQFADKSIEEAARECGKTVPEFVECCKKMYADIAAQISKALDIVVISIGNC